LDAKEEIRIACPYYDELFIDVLSTHAKNVSNLNSVAILAETMDPILLKACSLFPNAKVKTVFRSTSGSNNGQGLKVQGIHAKLMVADRSEVLLGSFNFRFSHIYYNIDLGLLAKGKIADHYARIYDLIWGSRP
jgi:phosphatidylserine/phosphatidylglycerophosphate/cardiolipin synthase-like enzyme